MDLRPSRRLAIQIGPLFLALLGLSLLYYSSGQQVQLVVNGDSRDLVTHARTVAGLMREMGIVVGARDRVAPAMEASLSWEAGRIPVVRLDPARPVSILAEGEHHRIETAETDPANLVFLTALQVYPGDEIRVNGLPSPERAGNPSHIELQRARPISLHLDGREMLFYSASPTLGEALWEAGIVVFEGDRVSPPASTALQGPLRVQIDRARPLRITIAEQVMKTRSAAESVANALQEAGVPLVGLDYSLPSSFGALPSDGEIQVVRVREEVRMEQEPLSFETVYQPLDTLEIDNQQILQPGAFGVLTTRLRVRTEDGEEVSRTVEGEWVAQEATPQILGYGTNIQIRSVGTADGALDYWRAVNMYATSYSPSRAGIPEDHPWFGLTASGKRLKKGLVAIDRSLIPFGTQMYVPGYGFAEAADTGGGVRGRWIDLGYEDHDWVSWSGYVTVYFLTPVPTPNNISYIFP